MSDRPAPVRIEDMAEPRYSDEARAILDFMGEAGSQLSLDPAGLMAQAEAEADLHDFGPPDFEHRLDVLCRAMREEGGFNAAGIFQQHTLILGLLRNRLLVEDLLVRHPEILDERITAPIVICGLPRTGTTHLHNLMSADPALRSLPYWESLEPVLADGERPVAGSTDPRVERTALALSFLDVAMPYFNRMHEMTVEHTHEEIQILAMDFSSMLFETTAPMPAWRDDYLARDQRPTYAYLVKVLKVMQWERGGTRWVLKSAQHLEQFPVLVDTFPGATFVVTHRDPVSVTASDDDDGRLLVPAHPGPGRPSRPRAHTGLIASNACCGAVPMTDRSSPKVRPSMSTSTSSCATTWPWSNGSTTWPASLWMSRLARPWRGSWRPTPEASSERWSTTWLSSASTRLSGGPPWPSTPTASGSRSRADRSRSSVTPVLFRMAVLSESSSFGRRLLRMAPWQETGRHVFPGPRRTRFSRLPRRDPFSRSAPWVRCCRSAR